MSNRLSLLLIVASFIAATACAKAQRENAAANGMVASRASPYFGQVTPGHVPERFAPGIVSTDAIELNGVFTPDLREFFFTRLIDGIDMIHHSVLEDAGWSAPRPLLLYPGQTRAVAVDMAVSLDGKELYFLGQHPNEYAAENPGYDLWVSSRVDGAWSTASVVPPPVSTSAAELYPVVVADGSLYFTSDRPGGPGRSNLYRAQRLADARFSEPIVVAPPINSESGVGDTYVAPDESYMIFSSRRQPSFGAGDLFVSFRLDDGSWSEPLNLGDSINTDEHEFCPMMTPDGKYFIFSRLYGGSWEKATGGDVYWVAAEFMDHFRRQ